MAASSSSSPPIASEKPAGPQRGVRDGLGEGGRAGDDDRVLLARQRVEGVDAQADQMRRGRHVRGVAGAARGVEADPARGQVGAQVGGQVAGRAVVGADQQRRPAGEAAVVFEQRRQQERAAASPRPARSAPRRRRRPRGLPRRARAGARSRRRSRSAVEGSWQGNSPDRGDPGGRVDSSSRLGSARMRLRRPFAAGSVLGAIAHHGFETRAGVGLVFEPQLGRRGAYALWGTLFPLMLLSAARGGRAERAPLGGQLRDRRRRGRRPFRRLALVPAQRRADARRSRGADRGAAPRLQRGALVLGGLQRAQPRDARRDRGRGAWA